MSKRGYWQRGVTDSNGNVQRFTMNQVWDIGKVVTIAGTKYRILPDGWRKVA